jgi:HK97 family phage portal protein
VTDSSTFIETIISHAILTGNGTAWIQRNNRQEATELWILDPQSTIIRYMDGELWYATTIDGEQRKFPGRDVFHVGGLGYNGVSGYSAIDLLRESIGLGLAAQQFGSRFFGSGANMSGLLMVPGHFQEDKIRNTMSAWQEMNQGLENAHKVALLQDGVKFQPMTVAPDAAQFLQTREFEVKTVANVLGLPPHLLGDTSNASYNSLEQENQSFLNHSLSPWLRRFEREAQRKLLSGIQRDRQTHFVEFNREASIQMLFKEKVDGFYRQVEMGAMSINEVRKKMNEPSIGEDGDKRYHPANWMEVGTEVMPDEPPQQDDEPQEAPQDNPQQQMLRALIASNVTDAVKIEQQRVVVAAKKEDNFCEWLDVFYQTWCDKSVSGLQSTEATNCKEVYAEESKRQLLDVAGSSTSSTLAGNVSELVATWNQRAESLITGLAESI